MDGCPDVEVVHNEAKMAALRVSSSVVKVIYRRKPGYKYRYAPYTPGRLNCTGTGTIIECEEVSNGRYISTVLTHATLFKKPTTDKKIKVDVSLSDGKICRSKLLASDPHYNLAVLRIKTDTPLPKINSLDDNLYMDLTRHFRLSLEEKSMQLRPHSDSFRYIPGEKVIALARPKKSPQSLFIDFGSFSLRSSKLNCKELFSVKGIGSEQVLSGGPLISYHGKVIGIMFRRSSFLPSNIISRWWKYYKSHREFRRPWIGIGVANLCSFNVGFLEQLIQKFPSVSTGVYVKEVDNASPAYRSGIRDRDIIIQFNKAGVQSTLEFFEKIWDNVGTSVELEVIRLSTGSQFTVTTTINEVTSDKFYRWDLADEWDLEDLEED